MATKGKHIQNEINQFNIFRKHIKSLQGHDDATVDALLAGGMIQVSTAHEHAVADVCGCTVVSEDCRDLDNQANSDCKLSTVRWSTKLKNYSAPISNVANKIGSLKVTVLEPHTGLPYFFNIPKSAYSYIKSNNTTIEIPFDTGGLPKRTNKWWQYEEQTFEDMAKNDEDPAARRLIANQRFFEQLPGIRGGKVTGKLSMTANAIRKRAARLAKREAEKATKSRSAAEE
jgi:hypothetical protein